MNVEWQVVDEERHIFRARMVFDPERYEVRVIDGKKGYYDKRSKLFIPIAALEKAAETLIGKPIYGPPNSIRDWSQYLTVAKHRIETSLESEDEWKPQLDRGDEFLRANLGRKLLFVVLYIDIVSSTQLSHTLSDVSHRTLISTFLREMSLIVDAHEGHIHKYTGDGLIAFFPAEQSIVGATDSAVDSARGMRLLMLDVLNQVLKTKNYPEIGFRIGIDSGETQIIGLGAENVKSTADMLGYTMDLASKICAVCPSTGIMIGESVFKTLHVTRQKYFVEANLPRQVWNYQYKTTNTLYPLYVLSS
jgi:class 3 adenylate cyclase